MSDPSPAARVRETSAPSGEMRRIRIANDYLTGGMYRLLVHHLGQIAQLVPEAAPQANSLSHEIATTGEFDSNDGRLRVIRHLIGKKIDLNLSARG